MLIVDMTSLEAENYEEMSSLRYMINSFVACS